MESVVLSKVRAYGRVCETRGSAEVAAVIALISDVIWRGLVNAVKICAGTLES